MRKISGITFSKLEVNKNYGSHSQYYIGDVKDYLVWEIPEAVRVMGLTNGKYYGHVYKLGVASFLLVVVEAEKSMEEIEVVIEKKDKVLCKLTVPKDSYIEFGDGEDIGSTVEEFVRNHNWSIAFY
jgi:hypothetical protein